MTLNPKPLSPNPAGMQDAQMDGAKKRRLSGKERGVVVVWVLPGWARV